MKKSDGEYGKEKTRVSLNLSTGWEYYDKLNQKIKNGYSAQECFVRAFEKTCDSDEIKNLSERVLRLEKKLLKKEDMA